MDMQTKFKSLIRIANNKTQGEVMTKIRDHFLAKKDIGFENCDSIPDAAMKTRLTLHFSFNNPNITENEVAKILMEIQGTYFLIELLPVRE